MTQRTITSEIECFQFGRPPEDRTVQKTVTDCDGCLAKDVKAKPIVVGIGTKPGRPGEAPAAILDALDLCPECLRRELQGFVDGIEDPYVGKRWAERVRGR